MVKIKENKLHDIQKFKLNVEFAKRYDVSTIYDTWHEVANYSAVDFTSFIESIVNTKEYSYGSLIALITSFNNFFLDVLKKIYKYLLFEQYLFRNFHITIKDKDYVF